MRWMRWMRWWILALRLLAVAGAAVAAGQRPRRFVAFREGSTFFYRLNYKLNMLPYTGMFAQASGFKVGWQLPEPRRPKPTKLSALELRDAARLLYHSHGLDGHACLMKSLCQSMALVSRQDGVLAKILNLMAGSNGANNATSLLDPLVCRNYANDCPLHLLGFSAAPLAHH